MHLTNKGHAYVYADVDNLTKYPMVIDTAANMGVLPSSIKGQLDLAGKKLSKETVTGGTGDMELEFVEIINTSIGSETQKNVSYMLRDLTKLQSKGQQTPGLIGNNYLSNYCVEFDFIRKQFKLTQKQCSTSQIKGLREVSFKMENNFIWTNATFGDTKVDVLFDTGAHHSFINSTLLNKLDSVSKGEKESFSALTDHEQQRLELFNVKYQLGEHAVEEGLMYYADMHVFNVLGYKDKPFLLLGIDYFKNGRLIIDYHSQTMYF